MKKIFILLAIIACLLACESVQAIIGSEVIPPVKPELFRERKELGICNRSAAFRHHRGDFYLVGLRSRGCAEPISAAHRKLTPVLTWSGASRSVAVHPSRACGVVTARSQWSISRSELSERVVVHPSASSDSTGTHVAIADQPVLRHSDLGGDNIILNPSSYRCLAMIRTKKIIRTACSTRKIVTWREVVSVNVCCRYIVLLQEPCD
jgi:hypothetical protein